MNSDGQPPRSRRPRPHRPPGAGSPARRRGLPSPGKHRSPRATGSRSSSRSTGSTPPATTSSTSTGPCTGAPSGSSPEAVRAGDEILVAWLLVDASESMNYGSGGRATRVRPRVQGRRDRDGVPRCSQQAGQRSGSELWWRAGCGAYLRPSGQMNQLREACRALADGPFAGPANLGRVLHELAGRTGRRGIVFVFSDLLDDVPDILTGLQHLCYHKHEVVVFHVLDAAELDFPFRHTTLFRGLEGLPEMLTDPAGGPRWLLEGAATPTSQRSRPGVAGWRSTTFPSAPTPTSATTSPRTCRSGTGGDSNVRFRQAASPRCDENKMRTAGAMPRRFAFASSLLLPDGQVAAGASEATGSGTGFGAAGAEISGPLAVIDACRCRWPTASRPSVPRSSTSVFSRLGHCAASSSLPRVWRTASTCSSISLPGWNVTTFFASTSTSAPRAGLAAPSAACAASPRTRRSCAVRSDPP